MFGFRRVVGRPRGVIFTAVCSAGGQKEMAYDEAACNSYLGVRDGRNNRRRDLCLGARSTTAVTRSEKCDNESGGRGREGG